MGFEFQHVKFSTLQPPGRAGSSTSTVSTRTSRREPFFAEHRHRAIPAELRPLRPWAGPIMLVVLRQDSGNAVFVSNISLTDNGKNYYGTYINDDWKVTPKLTVNLGLRWDFFGLVFEHHGNQANFVPGGPPTGGPLYLMPAGPNAAKLSTSFPTYFASATDGIALEGRQCTVRDWEIRRRPILHPVSALHIRSLPGWLLEAGLGSSTTVLKTAASHRTWAKTIPSSSTSSSLARRQSPHHYTRIAPAPAARRPIGSATLETGFSCTPLDPLLVNASGLALRGIQFDYITPYSMGGNFTVQYQLTPSMSIQAGYVTTLARHLEVFPNSNNVTRSDRLRKTPGLCRSRISGTARVTRPPTATAGITRLQTKVEKQFGSGLNFLATYTFSKSDPDALDLLNGGSAQGYRAPMFPDLESITITAWLRSIFGTYSTSAVAMSFPSVRASVT